MAMNLSGSGGQQFDVFISYSTVDAAWARRLKDALAERGLSVWLDRDEIRAGDLFFKNLGHGLRESAAFLIVVSPESMQSRWVEEEYAQALAQGNDREFRIIPCLLRDAPLPVFLAGRKQVDFRDDSKFFDSLETLLLGLRGKSYDPSTSATLATAPRRCLVPPPYPVPDLVGREQTLTLVRQTLSQRERNRLFGLYGLPGIGKTALALAIAYDPEIQQLFGYNIIWVGLGRNPDLLALLGALGAQLGIDPNELSALTTVMARRQRLREALAALPVLVIIDDAWRFDDALSFKIGNEQSAHLVTTRQLHIALDFAESQSRVEVIQELGQKESLELLTRYVPQLVRDLASTSEALAQAVGRLPLALIIIGSYLRRETFAGQQSRLRKALDRLADAEGMMHVRGSHLATEGIAQGDAEAIPTSLWEVIGLSYDVLDPAAQRLLRSLSAFPPKPNTFSENAACAVSLTDADAINTLVDCGLLEWSMVEPGDADQDRYTVHQTIDSYARARQDDQSEQAHLYERMVRFYIELVTYNDGLNRGYRSLEIDSANICAALRGAHARGLADVFLHGMRALFWYLESLGLYPAAEEFLQRAESFALEIDDKEMLASILNGRARIARKQGKYAEAEEWARTGLETSHDELVSCKLLGNLGGVVANLGRYREAAAYLDRALAEAAKMNDADQLSTLLRQKGAVAINLGEFDRAEDSFRQGLEAAAAAQLGRQHGRICAFLGELHVLRGKYTLAEELLKQGLAKAVEIGNREVECICRHELGTLEWKRGRDRAAERLLRESLKLARSMGHQERTSHVLGELTSLKIETGALEAAAAYMGEAREIAKAIGHPRRICYLMVLAARLATAHGRYEEAAEVAGSALDLARASEHWWNTGAALLALGDAQLGLERSSEALITYEALLARARAAAVPELAAAALFGTARVKAATGGLRSALDAAAESQALFAGIGHRGTRKLERWLADSRVVLLSG
jgi:tetratricopeptide (TPR) repeat protein